ncbi:MAG: sugar phosphate isomerase/epimerase [Firmicutes bacterium]|nr:sugar phosphate isomerase/epimerase [Bacillota bacterium]
MKLPVMLQVYSVGGKAQQDFAGTMKKIREIGYEYVELAGLYGHSVEEVKKALDDAGLKAISAHVGLDEIYVDIITVLDNYREIGCKYVAVPYLCEGSRPGDPAFDRVMKKMMLIGSACADRGMTLLYHNHDFEFVTMPDGSFGLDYLYSHVPADRLQTELDVCWVRVAGQDPAAYVRKYAGRAPVVHLKDYVGSKSEGMYNLIGQEETAKETTAFEFRPLGEGVQDIPSIVKAAEESGTEFVVVEQDNSYDTDPLVTAERSFKYLMSI